MTRFLNEVRSFAVIPIDGNHTLKFKLDTIPDPILANKELIVGTYDGKNYLMVNVDNELYSLSHDDFAFDFLKHEKEELDASFIQIDVAKDSIRHASSVIPEDRVQYYE